jgi:hypothetical protein
MALFGAVSYVFIVGNLDRHRIPRASIAAAPLTTPATPPISPG